MKVFEIFLAEEAPHHRGVSRENGDALQSHDMWDVLSKSLPKYQYNEEQGLFLESRGQWTLLDLLLSTQ
jgi:hypothetical protein